MDMCRFSLTSLRYRGLFTSLTALALAIPAGAATTEFSGTVTDSLGNALEGVTVSLAGSAGDSARTAADGSWRIAARSLGVAAVSKSQKKVADHLQVVNGHLQLSLSGYDIRGKSLGASRTSASAAAISAARTTSEATDTLVFSWNGNDLAHQPVGDGNRQGLQHALALPEDASWNGAIVNGLLLDARDGHAYRTVQIGRQTWMAENLNYRGALGQLDTLGVCFGDSGAACAKFGRLYSWTEALAGSPAAATSVGVRGVCPLGWHLPTSVDWDALRASVGFSSRPLKALSGWSTIQGTDLLGLRFLASGCQKCGADSGTFSNLHRSGFQWIYGASPWHFGIDGDNDNMYYDPGDSLERLSVRCLKDGAIPSPVVPLDTTSVAPWNASVAYGVLSDPRDGNTYRTVKVGRQIWMAENLNYRARTGSADTVGACFDDTSAACAKFGRLYSWSEALAGDSASDSSIGLRGVCPLGWHLPSRSEWDTLRLGVKRDSRLLKALSGWSTIQGTDTLGLRFLASGCQKCGADSGTFSNLHRSSFQWIYGASPEHFGIDGDNSNIYYDPGDLLERLSVRCLRGE